MKRWALLGVLLGLALAGVVFAPAAWLARVVASASSEHVLLTEARGTVWSGSAVPVLTGGVGSRDASALPGRLFWSVALDGWGLLLIARHACCLNGDVALRVVPGWGRVRFELPGPTVAKDEKPAPAATPIGQWPAAWLSGLGTPWNTLQLSGSVQLSSPGLSLEQVQGRWRFSGRAEIELGTIASRLSTLPVLGSYHVSIAGDAAGPDAATVNLRTTGGELLLSGNGQWAASKLRFQGQASAAPGSEAVLNNLLNIIGRRQGALSVFSIG